MTVAFLTLELTHPNPERTSGIVSSSGNSTRKVTVLGLDDDQQLAFKSKYGLISTGAGAGLGRGDNLENRTYRRGRPIVDMLEEVPAMLTFLESMGYQVVNCTSNSHIVQLDKTNKRVVRDIYLWTLRKAETVSQPKA